MIGNCKYGHFLALGSAILLLLFVSSNASAVYRTNNTYLDVTFGERSSDTWNFMYAPETWGDACYLEHFAVYTENWDSTKSSDYDFVVDRSFEDSSSGRAASLHYEDLNVTREVYVPPGEAKYFNISYTLTNANRTNPLRDVRLFEVVDFDIVTSGDSYGWYTEGTDTVWQNNDQYFRNGFGGDRPSTAHGMDYYSTETSYDWADGVLNGLNKYPEDGTADVAVGMQWNLSNLAPGESQRVTVTFYFGGSAGIYVDAGPEQTVGLARPVMLDASRSTSVDKILYYQWDLNDDGLYEVNVTSPRYSYEGWRTPGEHTVTLKATDDAGRNATAKTKITVVSSKDLASLKEAFQLSISPQEASTSPGGELAFSISLANEQTVPDSLTLNATGVQSSWISLEESADLRSGESRQVPLRISVPESAQDCNFTIRINAASFNLGASQEISASLNISSAPLISDLKPEDNLRSGSEQVVISWSTPVNSTGEVFIKSEDQTEFLRVISEPGRDHAVEVNLSRNKLYEFYVKSGTSKGTSQSEVRRIFVDNAIAFDRKIYEYTIERDYNQSVFIEVKNSDTEPHELLMQVSGVPQDLALNFIGEGSADQKIALLPGESRAVELVFHAQDAQSEDYIIQMNLTNLGQEAITDSALVKLHVHFPLIDYSLEEVKSDPYTLSKTFRITNRGDPLTDLSVSASGELSSLLVFYPSVDHAYLGTGGILEFVAEPVLEEGFTSAEGSITASAAGSAQSLSAAFTVPPGKSIFVGRQPNMRIEFAQDFDEDDLENTNPTSEVSSYNFKSGSSSALGFIAQVKVKVEQNGMPAYRAQVALDISGNGNSTTIYSPTDLWGNTIFNIYGLPGEYSYRASVQGFFASTESRTFTVSQTPLQTLEPKSVSWVSASDADRSFDLSSPASEAALNAPPYVIKARKSGLPAGATPILYMTDSANYSLGEVIGEVRGNDLIFNLGYIDPGIYSASIAVQSSSGMATSERRNLNFTGQDADLSYQSNYTYEMPFPVNASALAKLSINNTLAAGDPHKVVRLLYVLPDENSTNYVFTYLIVADRNMTDTLSLVARDKNGRVIYQNTSQVNLVELEPLFIGVPVPVYGEDGQRIEGIKVELEMQDYVLFFSDMWYLIKDPGAFIDGETWKIFFRNGMLTPNNRPGVVVKCFAGFVPGVNTVVTAVDTVNNGGNLVIDLAQGKPFEGLQTLGPTVGGSGQLALDPLLDWYEAEDTLRVALRDKLPHKVIKQLKDMMKGKPPQEQLKIFKDTYVKQLQEGKKLTRLATTVGILANIYSNYDDWKRVTEQQAKDSQKGGQVQSQSISIKSCINHAPLKNKFETPSYIPRNTPTDTGVYMPPTFGMPGRLLVQSINSANHSADPEPNLSASANNIEDVRVRLYFARVPPAEYKSFNTSVRLNGHIIGYINNTVPQGNYVFRADPSYLNYAERGAAENTVTLDVEGMNRGYYVPLDGYKIDILFNSLHRAVCSSSQEEADQAVMNLSGSMSRQADLVLTNHDVKISPASPKKDDNITVEVAVQNLGSLEARAVRVQLLVDSQEVDWREIPYLEEYSSQMVSFDLPASPGSHDVKVRINSQMRAKESDYSNNEATLSFTVAGTDSSNPTVGNLQPPDRASITYSLPLISADLGDEGSGINLTSVRMFMDGTDVTEKASSIPSRVWYTPKQPLSSGNHQAWVTVEDLQGNRQEMSWSFSISSDSNPPKITNPQPPADSTIRYARPLISASLADSDSGLDTASVRLELDGEDVSSKATVLPAKIWYTPELSLAQGDHNVKVSAKDRQGNANTFSWSFSLNEAAGPTSGSGNLTVCSEGCDYDSIQQAVNAASPGDTIEVRSGTYQENVNVTKSLRLNGVDRPEVDAGGKGSAVTLSADGIVMEGFRATNSLESGINVLSNNNIIRNNEVEENKGYGIHLYWASNNSIEGNSANGNGFGIYLGDFSLNNSVTNNTAAGNGYGIYTDLASYGNTLYLNDLIDNRDHNAYDFDTDLISANQWDDGSLGNYYSDLECVDADGNGVCEAEFAIPGGMSLDRYPRASQKVRVPETSSIGTKVNGAEVIQPTTPPFAGDLLYDDDFSDPQSGWPRHSTEEVSYAYDGGRFHITAILPDRYFYGRSKMNFEDFILEVEASKEEGPDYNIHGALLRYEDEDNYYSFAVSSDGRYRFDKNVDGKWVGIIGWTSSSSSAIRTGSSSNLIRIEAEGDKFTFYVNGVKVAEAFDGTFVSGDIGLFVGTYEEGNVHVSFDNLKVWSLKGKDGTAKTTDNAGPSPETSPMIVMDHGLAGDLDDWYGSATNMFFTWDTQAVSWLRIGPVYGPHVVKWDWYAPYGDLYNTFTTTIEDPRNSGKDYFASWTAYSYIDIQGNDAEFMPGDWRVDVYIDGEYILTEDFAIVDYEGLEEFTIVIDAPPDGWDIIPGEQI